MLMPSHRDQACYPTDRRVFPRPHQKLCPRFMPQVIALMRAMATHQSDCVSMRRCFRPVEPDGERMNECTKHCSCQLLAPPGKPNGSLGTRPPSVGLVPVRRPQLAATKPAPAHLRSPSRARPGGSSGCFSSANSKSPHDRTDQTCLHNN